MASSVFKLVTMLYLWERRASEVSFNHKYSYNYLFIKNRKTGKYSSDSIGNRFKCLSLYLTDEAIGHKATKQWEAYQACSSVGVARRVPTHSLSTCCLHLVCFLFLPLKTTNFSLLQSTFVNISQSSAKTPHQPTYPFSAFNSTVLPLSVCPSELLASCRRAF